MSIRCALALIMVWTAGASGVATTQSVQDSSDRGALIAALESLLTTGEPRHTDHDDGQRLQLAVDDAIARGDVEVEALAIRAAAPLTASVSRPVSSTRELPSVVFNAATVLLVRRSVAYSARVYASVDGGAFLEARTVSSGKSAGGPVDVVLSETAARPGFHAVQLKADLVFTGSGRSGISSWTESRTLPPLFYAVYKPDAISSAAIRALVYDPAATPVRELDPLLGDEPFAAWLSAVLATRTTPGDDPPDWQSRFCSERTAEAGAQPVATAVCSVVYFQSRGAIGQIWFRTADIRQSERGTEWVPIASHFEGLVVLQSAPQSRLSPLPSLLDSEARPVADLSILPADIVVLSAAPQPGAPAAVTVTVRNSGQGDVHKSLINVSFGVDPAARGTSRQFVVDLAAQASIELTVPVAFAGGYGFVIAQAMQISDHSPHESWTADPTPEDSCAVRIVNARAAPPRYAESVFAAAGCNGR